MKNITLVFSAMIVRMTLFFADFLFYFPAGPIYFDEPKPKIG